MGSPKDLAKQEVWWMCADNRWPIFSTSEFPRNHQIIIDHL